MSCQSDSTYGALHSILTITWTITDQPSQSTKVWVTCVLWQSVGQKVEANSET